MQRNFTVDHSIYLTVDSWTLDLHNYYKFTGFSYEPHDQHLRLVWKNGYFSPDRLPETVTIDYTGVTEFRFLPRDPSLPFTDDACISCLGYWADEPGGDNRVFFSDPCDEVPETWLSAVSFMSGAILAFRAAEGVARVEE